MYVCMLRLRKQREKDKYRWYVGRLSHRDAQKGKTRESLQGCWCCLHRWLRDMLTIYFSSCSHEGLQYLRNADERIFPVHVREQYTSDRTTYSQEWLIQIQNCAAYIHIRMSKRAAPFRTSHIPNCTVKAATFHSPTGSNYVHRIGQRTFLPLEF